MGSLEFSLLLLLLLLDVVVNSLSGLSFSPCVHHHLFRNLFLKDPDYLLSQCGGDLEMFLKLMVAEIM